MEVTNGASMRERAYEAAIDIIQNHEPYPLPEGVPETMDEIVKEFEKELGIARRCR
jgi:trimethylamine--corrinoid protein Co-methyltransferase